uniref:NADH-ubiquinone oxidoreductase chain 6 n=1 Tax=Porichthys myriaster TaxID=262771 RepID=Q5GM81_9TELE|nr:NADH dehydrogenase subunit 6 [Porichthys myriaster]
MVYMTVLVLGALFVGAITVASNPSPYFGALGLVVVAGMGCILLMEAGESFLSLVLFLIYLGGMMVVFVYTTALAADSYPEVYYAENSLGGMMINIAFIVFLVGLVWWWEAGGFWAASMSNELSSLLGGWGVGEVYGGGGKMLVVGGWVLFLTLFVVLELTRGLSRGSLREV